MLEIIAAPNNPTISVFIPFTRPELVNNFLKMFDQIIFPRERTELVFYCDNDDATLIGALRGYLTTATSFNGRRLYISGNGRPAEFSVPTRRKRIVKMKQKSTELLANSQFVFGLEDDTFIERTAFLRLYMRLGRDRNKDIGLISGVQVGRWDFRILGAWRFDSIYNPVKISTLAMEGKQIELVDGVGWYCYITRTSDYKAANYRWEDEGTGPDVCYAWDLRKKGKKVFVDRLIICEHHTDKGVLVPDSKVVVATWDRKISNWITKLPT